MTVGADQGRDAPGVRLAGPRAAFLELFDDALPVVHRYLFASTGGDADLTGELTAATFEAAARRAAAGSGGALALGTLLDTARSLLAARVTPLDPLTRPVPGTTPGSGGDGPPTGSAADLRRLPLGHRVVLALRYHDHLPVAEVARALEASEAVATEVLAHARTALGLGEPDPGEHLRQVYAALVARPDAGFVSRLRARLWTGTAGAPPGVTATGPAVAAGAGRPAAAASAGPGRVRAAGPRFRASAGGGPAAPPLLPLEIVAVDVGAPGGASSASRGAASRRDPLLARPGGGRLRRERSPRAWVAVAAVTVAAVVGLAVAGVGGGGAGGGAGGVGEPGPGDGGGAAGAAGEPRPPGTVPVRVVAPAEVLGTAVPEASSAAEVVTRTHLGPGGPYMNGPYAVAAGHEGLWATAVDDGGAWQAVRIDPETGETLAVVPVPGRVPSDLADHGIALSGGFVWVPALRDGLFRIDARSNRPSGVVGVAGGVVGAALDGGDGAVWAVGDDRVLRRIDARTTEVTAAATIPELGLMPDGADLAYGGGTVWVTVGDGAKRHLIGFDPVTLDRRYTYLVPPVGLVGDAGDLAADLDRVVIAEAPPGGVTIVDGTEGRVLASHRVAAAGIAVDGDRAWLLTSGDGLATVAWTRTGELLASAEVPPGVTDLVSTREGGVWAAVPSAGELVRLRFGG